MSDSFVKIALLGRPNVGKSTLFNRLIRSNRAITHDRAGITRDRMDGIVKAKGERPFGIIDTGGVTLDSHSQIEEGPEGIRGFEAAILEQAKDAVQESALLCLVVDAKDGLTPFDQHLADYLRKSGKPLILIVNKVDGPDKADLLMAEFHILGLPIYPCSAAHGYNVRELEHVLRGLLFGEEETAKDEVLKKNAEEELLLDGATKRQRKKLTSRFIEESKAAQSLDAEAPLEESREDEDAGVEEDLLPLLPTAEQEDMPAYLPDGTLFDPSTVYFADEEIPVEEDGGIDLYSGPVRIALLGRPNAGKSSLVNAMTSQNRMIVSDIAGTTRDSVDVTTIIDGEECTFVDTAGVRRRAKIKDTVERYSVNSSLKSTTKAHVTLLVLAADEGLTLQDKRLIDLLAERKTPFMVLINKCDLIEPNQRKNAEKMYKEAMVFCPHVPLLFVSALKKRNLNKIVPLARTIRNECGVRIGTGQLNRSMTEVLAAHQPPMVKGARPKFFYLTQAESFPPTFVFFVSDADRILASYGRYLEKSLRKLFGIKHAPMRVHFRSSHKKK